MYSPANRSRRSHPSAFQRGSSAISLINQLSTSNRSRLPSSRPLVYYLANPTRNPTAQFERPVRTLPQERSTVHILLPFCAFFSFVPPLFFLVRVFREISPLRVFYSESSHTPMAASPARFFILSIFGAYLLKKPNEKSISDRDNDTSNEIKAKK